jgi:hypothetical protein
MQGADIWDIVQFCAAFFFMLLFALWPSPILQRIFWPRKISKIRVNVIRFIAGITAFGMTVQAVLFLIKRIS